MTTPERFAEKPDPVRAAGFVLFRRMEDGTPRFLLLETQKGGHYSPPKGHLEPGETDEEAALRETLEECGLEPRFFERGFRVEIAYDVVKKGRSFRKEVVYFLAEASPGDVRLSCEHVSARWAKIEEVLLLVPFENLRRVFEECAAHLSRARS